MTFVYSQDHFVKIYIYCTVSTSSIWQYGSAWGPLALFIHLDGMPEAGRVASYLSQASEGSSDSNWGLPL